MKHLPQRVRPEPLLILILSLLSASVISGAVVVGLNGLAVGSAEGAITTLPDGLFSPEPARALKLAPVAASITSELSATPTVTASLSPSPSATTRVGVKQGPSPSSPASPKSSPSPSTAPTSRSAMGITMSAELQNQNKIKYTSTVSNTGGDALSAVVFKSHVPAQTVGKMVRCGGGDAFKVIVSYSNGTQYNECIPGSSDIQGSDDPSIHPVSLQLRDPIGVNESVTISFTVNIASNASGDITNHSHADANGLHVNSLDVVIKP